MQYVPCTFPDYIARLPKKIYRDPGDFTRGVGIGFGVVAGDHYINKALDTVDHAAVETVKSVFKEMDRDHESEIRERREAESIKPCNRDGDDDDCR